MAIDSATCARTQPLDTLKEIALRRLGAAEDGLVIWAQSMRPASGAKGRFLWARETTRDANVASTGYLLLGLQKMGLLEKVIDAEDRAAGIAWVRAMCVGDEQYRDPNLLDRKSPGWPVDKPWPTSGCLGVLNKYARTVLTCLGYDVVNLPASEPPPGWPQANEADEAVEWIKTRPWNDNAWGACSHSMKMATWLLQWRREGRVPLDPLVRALKFIYGMQDPETGLWGTADQPRYERINGTYKLFLLIREALALPLPHADRIIDQVLDEFQRPDYDETASVVEERDNWYVITLALEVIPDYRPEEIRKLAAWRLARALEVFGKPDGGLSSGPEKCCSRWLDFDMAPDIAQSDAMAIGTLCGPVNVCVALLGLAEQASCDGKWHMGERAEESPRTEEPLRTKIESLVFGD